MVDYHLYFNYNSLHQLDYNNLKMASLFYKLLGSILDIDYLKNQEDINNHMLVYIVFHMNFYLFLINIIIC